MSVSWHEAKALIELYKTHGPLGRTATLGQQVLYLNRRALTPLLRGITGSEKFLAEIFGPTGTGHADGLLRLLGSTEVVSIDNSNYEGASFVHDMNSPLPPKLRDSFDFVYDGGTLEHVFDFPQAVRNCVQLLKVGGVFAGSTPANNFLGHGFYQFSPELFFRLFCPENGFRMERLLAFEYAPGGSWFEVEDPRKLGRRAELLATRQRTVLWVQAKKMEARSGDLTSIPQQSDYARQWQTANLAHSAAGNTKGPSDKTLRVRAEDLCPCLADSFRGVREKLRVRASLRTGLRQDGKATSVCGERPAGSSNR